MKTIFITGGTDGIGKAIAMHLLKKGDRVIVAGSSSAKGDIFYSEAKLIGAEERAIFLQANLSLVRENQRSIEEVKNRFNSLDMLIFCAAKHSKEYTETIEGFELTFALAYLSRFILSYGLKECLEQSDNPVILNICAPGMKGEVNWNDLQHKKSFAAQRVMFHGSRLNDMSGVAFAQNDTAGKVKYILYNPWAVQTSGMMETFKNPVMKMMYKIIGKPAEKAIEPIIELLNNPPATSLSAYRERKKISLTMKTFDKENAKRLFDITAQMMKEFEGK